MEPTHTLRHTRAIARFTFRDPSADGRGPLPLRARLRARGFFLVAAVGCVRFPFGFRVVPGFVMGRLRFLRCHFLQ